MSNWIKIKRKEAGLSQFAVAEMLGISRPTYVNIENGKSKLTEEYKLILSRVFNLSPNAIEKNSKEVSINIKKSNILVRKIPKENVQKFKETLLYVLNKVGNRPNIGQTVLYKLLYFIDFDYYEKFEEQLIGATYIKNTYGPTPISFAKIAQEMENTGEIVEVRSKFFDHNQMRYMPVREANVSLFSGQELKHIDDELERLAHRNARELSELSHLDTPWKIAKDKEVLDYEYVFYRPEETSVREYEPL